MSATKTKPQPKAKAAPTQKPKATPTSESVIEPESGGAPDMSAAQPEPESVQPASTEPESPVEVTAPSEADSADPAAKWAAKVEFWRQKSIDNSLKFHEVEERARDAEAKVLELEGGLHEHIDKVHADYRRDIEALKMAVASITATYLKARDLFQDENVTVTVPIPLGDSRFFLIRPPATLTEEDVELVIETLKVWQKRLVSKEKTKPLGPQEIVASLEGALRIKLNGLAGQIEAMTAAQKDETGTETGEDTDNDNDDFEGE